MLIFFCIAGKQDTRGPRDLSEEPHYQEGSVEHNMNYDHEAFLGKEDAKDFKELPFEEAQRRLGYF